MTKLIKNCFNKKHQRLLRVVTTCRILRILVPESCFNDHPIRRGFFFCGKCSVRVFIISQIVIKKNPDTNKKANNLRALFSRD